MPTSLKLPLLLLFCIFTSGCPGRFALPAQVYDYPGAKSFDHVAQNPQEVLSPGMVIALWKGGAYSVLCIPETHFAYSDKTQVTTSNPILLSEEGKRTLSADLSVKAKNVVEAALQGKRVRDVAVKMELRTIQDMRANDDIRAATNAPQCQDAVAFYRERYPELKFLSFVTKTSLIDITYEVTLDSALGVGVELGKAIGDKLGVDPKIEASVSDASKITISGAKLIIHFSTDNRVPFKELEQ